MLTRRELLALSLQSGIVGAFAGACSLGNPTVTAEVSHRPWPLPRTWWVLAMRWHDLLFLHWPIRPALMRPLIPSTLELDTFDGWCWIAVVPFHMTGVRPRFFPISLAFPELNVRTYVKRPDRSGVWFFSLDAASWISVRAARWFGLPYYDARMTVQLDGDAVHYQSSREHNKTASIEFNASYRPTAPEYRAAPGTLDHWLTERYCLYGARKPGHVVYGEIHHPQWRLQPAEVEVRANSMTQPIGLELPNSKPISHVARYQEVVAWPIVPLERN